MRLMSVVSVLALAVASGACGDKVGYRGLSVKVEVPVRARVHVDVDAAAAARARAGAKVEAEAAVEVPAPEPVAVAVEGAPVAEFFGIPLEGAADVVFVLDRSGSMRKPAQGRAAALRGQEPAAAPGMGPAESGFGGASGPAEPGAAGPDARRPPDWGAGGAPPPGAEPTPQGELAMHGTPVPPPPPPGAEATPEDLAMHGAPAPPPPPPRAEATSEDPAMHGAPAPPPPPQKIEVARRELIEALRRVEPGVRINVIFFNAEVEGFAPGLVAVEDSSREELIRFVEETPAQGMTALAMAMRTALLMNPRRVVLLSDGLGNVGDDAGAILRDAREAMRGGVRIDTIGLGRNQDEALLRALAVESGGLYQQF